MWLWVVTGIVVSVGFVAFTGAPYVPSKRRDIVRAFTELYPLTSRDVLVDIGSGDGVVLRMASARGARAIGYELHPILVAVSRYLSRHDSRVVVHLANFWRSKLPHDTTVVYVFGDARDITKIFAHIEREVTRLGHDVSLISYGFEIAGRKPTRTVGAHHLYHITPLQST